MNRQSIIPQKLRTFEYYKNKLPLYLQNSYGFQEHFRIWYDFLAGDDKGLVTASEEVLSLLDIFDDDYLTTIAQLEDANVSSTNTYGTVSDMLDKIGALFGVTRNFTITYTDTGETVTESLSLNNEDFLILIKTQIIRNYCEGTYEQINEYYKSIKLQLYSITESAGKAIVYLVISSSGTYSYSENIRKMFLAGMLKIDSMGIIYQYAPLDLVNLLIWDGSTNWADENGVGGQWGV